MKVGSRQEAEQAVRQAEVEGARKRSTRPPTGAASRPCGAKEARERKKRRRQAAEIWLVPGEYQVALPTRAKTGR